MKSIFCLILALCLTLCACAGTPVGTTLPGETDAPAQTAAPTEAAPTETQAAALPQTVTVSDPEMPIYAGPSAASGCVALVGEAGVYTIVEETWDADGNHWGSLKSGAGWICLTEPLLAPIYADYAAEDFNAYYAYWNEGTDFITSIGFTPSQTLKGVRFGLLDWFETESWQMSRELFTIDEMDPEHPFLAQVIFWGDMTTYGISFEDARGEDRFFAISVSGKDGSLVCQEYLP